MRPEHRCARRHPAGQQDHSPDGQRPSPEVRRHGNDDRLRASSTTTGCPSRPVGDSRVYRRRDEGAGAAHPGPLAAQELVERGLYSREEAERVTVAQLCDARTRGQSQTIEGNYDGAGRQTRRLVRLLCSDGLPDMVEDDGILLTIRTFQGDLELAGRQLVQLGTQRQRRQRTASSVLMARVLKPFSLPTAACSGRSRT